MKMINDDFTVDSYVADPTSVEPDIKFDSPELIAVFEKMLSRSGNVVTVKRRRIKRIRNVLINTKTLLPFALKFKRTLKAEAYMRDEGEVVISYGMIITRSSATLLSVYMHELAHVWLSQQSFYDKLKSVQKEFKKRYASINYAELISPIEFYANYITLKVLEDIQKQITNKARKKKLLKVVTTINERVQTLKKLITDL